MISYIKIQKPKRAAEACNCVRLSATGVQQNLNKRERGKELVHKTRPGLEKMMPEPQPPIHHLLWREVVSPPAGTHRSSDLLFSRMGRSPAEGLWPRCQASGRLQRERRCRVSCLDQHRPKFAVI